MNHSTLHIIRFLPKRFAAAMMVLVIGACWVGCAGSRQVTAPIPSWVMESPVSSSYYIGIGSASKAIHPLDADAVAKRNALDNLSREIRVQVQATSTMNTLQVNDWLSTTFNQQSTSTTQEDLEGFELVDTYASDKEVMVYYRLSKAEHARIQAAKRQAAMDVAAGHLESAEEFKGLGQAQQAVDAAIRGLDAIRPFMDRPLKFTHGSGEQIDLTTTLLGMIDDCVAGLALSSEEESLTLRVENRYQGTAEIDVLLDGKPAPNVTLTYAYHRGDLPTRGEVVTDARGVATIRLERFEPQVTETTLEVRVDPLAFAAGLPLAHPFRQAAQGLQSAPLRLPVVLAPVELALVVDELAFGKTRDRKVLTPAVQEALQSANVSLVSTQATRSSGQKAGGPVMTLTLQADARPGGQGQGFTTVYLDVVGTVTSAEGETIFTQTQTKIKGVQLDLPRATDAAYDKASQVLQDDFIPQLIRLWHGF